MFFGASPHVKLRIHKWKPLNAGRTSFINGKNAVPRLAKQQMGPKPTQGLEGALGQLVISAKPRPIVSQQHNTPYTH